MDVRKDGWKRLIADHRAIGRGAVSRASFLPGAKHSGVPQTFLENFHASCVLAAPQPGIFAEPAAEPALSGEPPAAQPTFILQLRMSLGTVPKNDSSSFQQRAPCSACLVSFLVAVLRLFFQHPECAGRHYVLCRPCISRTRHAPRTR